MPGVADRLCLACHQTMIEAEAKQPMKDRSWELFALQVDDHFEHFYPGTIGVKLCGDEPIVLVRLTQDSEGPYWGWYHSHHPVNKPHQGHVSFIYRFRQAVSMCFAYGPEIETKCGRGEIVRLRAEFVRLAVHPEGIKYT